MIKICPICGKQFKIQNCHLHIHRIIELGKEKGYIPIFNNIGENLVLTLEKKAYG